MAGRPTHVVVFGIDGEGKQADWLMPIEEFAKLFTYGQTLSKGPNGTTMSQDIRVRSKCHACDQIIVPRSIKDGPGLIGATGSRAPVCSVCGGGG